VKIQRCPPPNILLSGDQNPPVRPELSEFIRDLPEALDAHLEAGPLADLSWVSFLAQGLRGLHCGNSSRRTVVANTSCTGRAIVWLIVK
jgi:hypothetical protein